MVGQVIQCVGGVETGGGRIIRVFPRRTKWTPDDDWSFVGAPSEPLLLPRRARVLVSAAFTWDRPEAQRLAGIWRRHYADVQVGGPAYDDPGGTFEPGVFVKFGVTITSRGCPKRCGFCLAAAREGELRELPIRDGWIVQDNNLLACSREHVEAVFAMLRRVGKPAQFKGGLDLDYLMPWHVDLLRSVRVDEIWVACDTEGAVARLARARDLLADFSIEKRRCYCLLGYEGDTPERAEARCAAVYAQGFLPFAQLYQPATNDAWHFRDYSLAWRLVRRKWSRPAAYRGRKINPQPSTIENSRYV